MKTALTLCAGLIIGGAGWALIQWASGGTPDDSTSGEPAPVVPRLAGDPEATSPADGAASEPSPEGASRGEGSREAGNGAETAPSISEAGEGNVVAETPLPPKFGGAMFFAGDAAELAPRPASGLRPAPPTSRAADVVAASVLTEQRELAFATFDAGDAALGKQLLERIYAVWKDQGMDLTAEVTRLLEIETEFVRRREYLRYLAARGSGGEQLFAESLGAALESLKTAFADSASAFRAWEELSLAYEAARDSASRTRVLGHLRPFLERVVFSGRSPLVLETYTVRAGDNLTAIAVRHGTTVGSIQRLNGLASDVIRPGVRLRILVGKIEVFVKKSEFRLWVTVDGRVLLERPVGLGKLGGTPVGSFVVKVKEKDPAWWPAGRASIPPGHPDNVLGSRWLGFEATEQYSGYGIHGTQDPRSIGVESSAGCVRMNNVDVELLYDLVPYKTRVTIAE